MTAFWTSADWDEHERVELVHDRASGLTAIIALHSTHLGPARAARGSGTMPTRPPR
jgi:leucine dehydrogenase